METESGAEYISELHVRHVLRYVQAAKHIGKNNLVLDAPCGTGYGSKILAQHCRKVIGVDSSSDAIKEACKNRPKNCDFMQTDLLTAKFWADEIVALEILEHFNREVGKILLKNFRKWTDGKLILSTPYCSKSGRSPITKQHQWEYSLSDLEMALNECGWNIKLMELQRKEGQAGRLGYCMVVAK